MIVPFRCGCSCLRTRTRSLAKVAARDEFFSICSPSYEEAREETPASTLEAQHYLENRPFFYYREIESLKICFEERLAEEREHHQAAMWEEREMETQRLEKVLEAQRMESEIMHEELERKHLEASDLMESLRLRFAEEFEQKHSAIELEQAEQLKATEIACRKWTLEQILLEAEFEERLAQNERLHQEDLRKQRVDLQHCLNEELNNARVDVAREYSEYLKHLNEELECTRSEIALASSQQIQNIKIGRAKFHDGRGVELLSNSEFRMAEGQYRNREGMTRRSQILLEAPEAQRRALDKRLIADHERLECPTLPCRSLPPPSWKRCDVLAVGAVASKLPSGHGGN